MIILTGRLARWGAVFIVLLACVLGTTEGQPPTGQIMQKRLEPLLHWVTKNWVNDAGQSAPYLTTKEASDLDNEVRLGAKILKFRDGTYARAIHKQYPEVCGPATLTIILKQIGISDPPRTAGPGTFAAPRRPVSMPRDVDREGTETVDVGYGGSMEHLMWLGYHSRRLNIDGNSWNAGRTNFMSREGVLEVAPTSRQKAAFDGNRLDYYPGAYVPAWMWHGPAVGYMSGDDYYTGLTGVMNYIFSGGRNGPWRDAMPLTLRGDSDAEVVAYRRVIKGFIDHGLSIACGVEDGGHFNALIGYRGSVEPASAQFFVYTADPLDGWGRSPDNQPLTWRRILVSRDNLRSGKKLLVSIICWNHHAEGGADVQFRRGGWAELVDRQNGNSWLTGSDRQPPARDPLNDPLARPLER